MNIGKEIKARRLKLKLTQQGLADKLGVTKQYVSDIEIGRKSPSLETIAPFIKNLGGKLKIEWKD